MDNKDWENKKEGHDHQMDKSMGCEDKVCDEKHRGKTCGCGCAHTKDCNCKHM